VVSEPDKKSLISTLMIMGQAGGALFPVSMGLAFDKVGLTGSIAVLSVAVAYLVFYTIWFKPAKTDA
jgi:fucose permease